MDKQPNLYKQFLKDIHPELFGWFKRFIKEKDIYKQFIEFAHSEFGKDFKKYTERCLHITLTGVARFYVGKLPSCRSDEKDRPLSSFLEKWSKADGKQKAELKKGPGYGIGFGQSGQ